LAECGLPNGRERAAHEAIILDCCGSHSLRAVAGRLGPTASAAPPTTDKGTLWYVPHTHWEGAVFKTREEYLEMGLPTVLRVLNMLKRDLRYSFNNRIRRYHDERLPTGYRPQH